MESTLPPAPHSRSAGAKTPESPKNPLQLGCSVTQIRHFFKRTFFNLPLIFENNVKKDTVWLHERDEIYRFRKASPFGRGVAAGDGEGKPVKAGRRHSDRQALCQRDGIAARLFRRQRPCPLRRSRASSPKGRAFEKQKAAGKAPRRESASCLTRTGDTLINSQVL